VRETPLHTLYVRFVYIYIHLYSSEILIEQKTKRDTN